MWKSCAGTLLMFRPRRHIVFLITQWAAPRPLELGELHRRRSEQPAAWQPAGLQYPFLAYRLMTAYHTITPPTSFFTHMQLIAHWKRGDWRFLYALNDAHMENAVYWRRYLTDVAERWWSHRHIPRLSMRVCSMVMPLAFRLEADPCTERPTTARKADVHCSHTLCPWHSAWRLT